MYILITNFHSIQNKGDLGIVMGLVYALRERMPGVRFGIIGRYVEEREWWKTESIDFYTPLLRYPRHRGGTFSAPGNKLRALYFFFMYQLSLVLLRTPRIARWYYRSSPEALETLAAYGRADAVISKGGSFFREPEYRLNLFPIGIFAHLHQLRAGLSMGIPVLVSGQSFGPIRNVFSIIALRRAFRRLALITTRENDSRLFLKNTLGIERNVELAGDSAFLLPVSPKSQETGKEFRVGLTVRSWSHAGQYENYLNSIVSLINTYTQKNYTFFLMPQVTGPSQVEDDRISSREVLKRLRPEARGRTTLIEETLEFTELLRTYHTMDYFIATRLHSAIFALLGAVPTMAIEYEPKTSGIFKDIGISPFVSDIRLLSPEKLERAFENLLSAPKQAFVEARDRGVRSANHTIDVMMEVLEPHS